ncbi:hypothetical protein [Streptomyces sp. KS 21]|uniref:hypothetical protein n=1 Tax=Streptomyces sp. KS 21 TaxID=2485150 RepID=UPI0010E22129|nr:hypothetical protein [Streptomyces sp. KS 21]TDU78124.1 hypothetical protein EDD91_4898 [Streptomyces sp. KS 21]
MAGPVCFRKVSEDPETVRCAFGPDPEGMTRTLTMHKAPPAPRQWTTTAPTTSP